MRRRTLEEKRLNEFCLGGYVYCPTDCRPDHEAVVQLGVWAKQALAHPAFPKLWLYQGEVPVVKPYREAGLEVFHAQWLRQSSGMFGSKRVEAMLLEVALSLPHIHVEEYQEGVDKLWRIRYR